MKSVIAAVAAWAPCLQAASLPSNLQSRQSDGAVPASAFLRRAYHSSVVLNGHVYIDGGEFSYTGGSGPVLQYSTTLLYIDLRDNWDNNSVTVHSIAKPSGVANLRMGGLWLDEAKGVIYTGFEGIPSQYDPTQFQPQGLWSFTPDATGKDGTWKNLNSTADKAFTGSLRANKGATASGAGAGYMLGGFGGNGTNPVVISGMLKYDFAKQTLTNSTVTGISTNGVDQMGNMVYIPNFGPQGVIVSVGGDQWGGGQDSPLNLISMNTVQIFDPATGSWYEQATTGSVPEGRKEFCVAGAASDNRTYELFVYAGWGGNLGSAALPFDEAFVLTLPAFHWVKANYPALHPRHALSCEHVGGGQVLTIGGVDTTQEGAVSLYDGVFDTPDRFNQGLNIFDLGKMAFATSYAANRTSYTAAKEVQDYYNNNPRKPTFQSSGLGTLFSVENFTSTSNTSQPSPTGSSSAAAPAISGGAIAGIVVGVLAVILIAVGVLFLLRRRRRRRGAGGRRPQGPSELDNGGGPAAELASGGDPGPLDGGQGHHHGPGGKYVGQQYYAPVPGAQPGADKDAVQYQQPHEMESTAVAAQELPGNYYMQHNNNDAQQQYQQPQQHHQEYQPQHQHHQPAQTGTQYPLMEQR